MILLSSDGSVHSWKDASISWTREESLAHAVGVEFVDLPEKKLWSQEVDELGMDTYTYTQNFSVQFYLLIIYVTALDEDAEKVETITPLNRYIRRVSTHISQLRV